MAPWKCPDCGIWWSGLEHRCRPPMATTTNPRADLPTRTIAAECICASRLKTGWCPIHDFHLVP